MARPRSFDSDAVLDRALDTFWRQGYEATSMQDLVEAMGISRASLYNAFGSKHALFLDVLRRYEKQRLHAMVATLQAAGSVRSAIRTIFEQTADEAASPDGRGCLLTNTATELCARDDACSERVQANFRRVESAFEAALCRAQDTGEIAATHNTEALARYFTNALQGLRVMATTTPDRAALQDIVNVTMQVLD